MKKIIMFFLLSMPLVIFSDTTINKIDDKEICFYKGKFYSKYEIIDIDGEDFVCRLLDGKRMEWVSIRSWS